jgi:hypothetical protein
MVLARLKVTPSFMRMYIKILIQLLYSLFLINLSFEINDYLTKLIKSVLNPKYIHVGSTIKFILPFFDL